MADLDVVSDNSYKCLTCVPERLLQLANLKMLYLDGNIIERLPEDFFQKLPKLYWLDLRSNRLTAIPVGVANHRYLENILLQGNLIQRLPDELGLVPNLKVLQLTGNPLVYPPKDVVERGVDDICIFLKQEYYMKADIPPSIPNTVGSSSTVGTPRTSAGESSSAQSNLIMPVAEAMPMIIIKGLSRRAILTKQSCSSSVCPKDRKVHRVRKSATKLSVRSHYNSDKYLGVLNMQRLEKRMEQQQLKELWLGKLTDLIRDQEKIIQQEKTLSSLASWRKEKREEEPRSASCLAEIREAPYDTEPLYNKLMSRTDLTRNVDRLVAAKKKAPGAINVDRLINDVVCQLKGLEAKLAEDVSPSEKLRKADEEIQLIVDLHKKISRLQGTNDYY